MLLLTLLLSLVHGQSDNGRNDGSAVFTYSSSEISNFVFALNADRNGDLYFHLSGPAEYSWTGVGIGEDMPDNLFFIAYAGEDGEDVTLSPRIAFHGNSEPTYESNIDCKVLSSTGSASSSSGTRSVDAVCHNATTWNGGALSLSSSSQPFMFAFGPKGSLKSDSPSVGLQRHELYGNFNMDIQQAVSTSSAVPSPNGSGGAYVRVNAEPAEGVTSDSDTTGIIHGIVACVAYLLLFPLGAFVIRLAKRAAVRIHWIWQTVAAILVLVGFGFAVDASGQYNRSRDFSDPHQVLGIITLVAVAVQITLGAVHHLIFKKKGKGTVLGKIHRVVGPCIILIAVVNGGLGLDLACKSTTSTLPLQSKSPY